MTHSSDSSTGRLVHIQYLRGVAALLVVLHHSFRERAGYFSPLRDSDFGYAGVLTFFVISGFVMMYACRHEPPLTFAVRRIIRVVPLYWAMSAVAFIIVARDDIAAGEPFRSIDDLVLSLLFVPHYHA